MSPEAGTLTSPFPGMDPYLEQRWGDVHHRLITYSADQLQGRLPGGLRARVEERVYVQAGDEVVRVIAPDVRIVARPGRERGGAAVLERGFVAEPVIVEFASEGITEGYIEIRDVFSGDRLVTVIEFLSRTNKAPGEGRLLDDRKRDELFVAGVSQVEIDLLRGGDPNLTLKPTDVPPEDRAPYAACVRRAGDRFRAAWYGFPLREPLPGIRIPLRESDEDVPLYLQPLIDQVYSNGRYDDLDYSVAPDPPLAPDDAAWADALLRAAGHRGERSDGAVE